MLKLKLYLLKTGGGMDLPMDYSFPIPDIQKKSQVAMSQNLKKQNLKLGRRKYAGEGADLGVAKHIGNILHIFKNHINGTGMLHCTLLHLADTACFTN